MVVVTSVYAHTYIHTRARQNAYLTDWVLGTVAHKQFEGKAPLLFRPLFEPESSTYTYVLADSESVSRVLYM